MRENDHESSWRIPATYTRVFIQHAAALKLPMAGLLRGTGLQEADLAGTAGMVSFDDTRRVIRNVTERLGAGWHLSLASRMTAPAHGTLGFAAVTAPDLQGAVDMLLRFIGIRAPFVWLAGAVEGEHFVLRLQESTALGPERSVLLDLALLSIQSLLERPLGRPLDGARIALGYPAPAYSECLEAALHPAVSYGHHGHSLSFPAAWLDEPCALHDEGMHRYLVARCEEELRLASGALPAEIAVRQALLARPARPPSLSELAAGMHISPRTLIRRLERGDTSYQAVLEDVRRNLAADYLRHSALGVARIGYRLGYTDPANFGRAFRRWYGVSPGRYRRQHKAS